MKKSRLIQMAATMFLSAGIAAAFAQESLESCISAKEKLTSSMQRASTTPAERLQLAKLNMACAERDRSNRLADAVNKSRATGQDAMNAQLLADSVSRADLLDAQRLYAKAQADANFAGMTFGVGIGFSQAKDRLDDATLAADGTVRVLTRQKQTPRVILEAHYYGLCKMQSCLDAKTGIGPFFGLAAANDTIEAFALGVMFGWKEKTDDSAAGFSVGVGAVLDREVKTLAKGFAEGKPPPAGETAVVFEKRSKWSPLLFFTRTF